MIRDTSSSEKLKLIKQNLQYLSFMLEIAQGMVTDALDCIENGNSNEGMEAVVDMHITLVDANAFYRSAAALHRLIDA